MSTQTRRRTASTSSVMTARSSVMTARSSVMTARSSVMTARRYLGSYLVGQTA